MGEKRRLGYVAADTTEGQFYPSDIVFLGLEPLGDREPLKRCWMVFARDSETEPYHAEPWSTEVYAQARASVVRRRRREVHVAPMVLSVRG